MASTRRDWSLPSGWRPTSIRRLVAWAAGADADRGGALAGRAAASLLHAMDLGELTRVTQGEYEARAIEIATSADQGRPLKRKVEARRSTSSLFDGRYFARKIEIACEAMLTRYEAGLGPDAIELEAPV